MDFPFLSQISEPVKISDLTEVQLKELQVALSRLGYPVGDIDGLIGPRTKGAWAEFKTDVFQGNPELIGIASISTLKEKLEFVVFDFSTRESTINEIKMECRRQGLKLNAQIAYVLATTQWETAQTFRPVRESYWWDNQYGFEKAEKMRQSHANIGRYFPYYGRGYVQITWRTNYEKYSKILGIDLVNNPDLALQPETALFILVHGFKTGTFTGRKISDYIDQSKADFLEARRCINGLDKNKEIAAIAQDFLCQLNAEGTEKLVLLPGSESPITVVDLSLGIENAINGETITALSDTWLKKDWRKQASELDDTQKAFVPKGKTYSIEKFAEHSLETEMGEHGCVELSHGAGQWYIFLGHWQLPWAEALAQPHIDNLPEWNQIQWDNWSDPVSRYFNVGEVTLRQRARIPTNPEHQKNVVAIARQMDKIREWWGSGLLVNSWYRPPAIEILVDGSGANHPYGFAVDIRPAQGSVWDLQSRFEREWYNTQKWNGGFGQGAHKSFIHLDLRHRRTWRY